MNSTGKFFGGTLLVGGTAIGAGMLALPINTASGGFLGASSALILTWLCMTLAALLMLEVSLTMPGETNFISMSKKTIGKYGQIITWFLYLILLYALISTYIQAGSSWFRQIALETFHKGMDRQTSFFIFLLAFGVPIFWGTKLVDKLNRVLAIGLLGFYLTLIALSLPTVKLSYIQLGNGSSLIKILPLLLTSFGFSTVIPSLTHYFDKDYKTLKKVIILGSLLPLTGYLIWEFIVLGNIPMNGTHGMLSLMHQKDNGTSIIMGLEAITQNPYIKLSARFFAIFSILTSFLGVSLGLFDFLSDGLKLPDNILKRPFIFILTYLPPIILLLFYVTSFDKILSFAGVFVSLLLGILPILMVWSGRYSNKTNDKRTYQVFGGKILLVLLFIFFTYSLAQGF
ncbi:MAG: tryptophan/tyrosine permease [Desulfobacteraceae bacterium]|nr:tryptophan/tyrosine permease [Desulfobacteraceae bacterium]